MVNPNAAPGPPDEESLISALPLTRTWLNDIVDILQHRPDGTAEVGAITIEMMRSERDVGAAPDETITRTINNYCSDANDSGRVAKHDLFERIARGTYKLRSFPQKPDLIEIQSIEFTDPAYASTWDWFCKVKQRNPKWDGLSKHQRLAEFARSIQIGGPVHAELQHRIAYYKNIEGARIEDLI